MEDEPIDEEAASQSINKVQEQLHNDFDGIAFKFIRLYWYNAFLTLNDKIKNEIPKVRLRYIFKNWYLLFLE